MQLPPPPHFQNISSQPRQMTAWVQRLDIQGLWPKYYKRPVIGYTVQYVQILANIHITTTYSSYWPQNECSCAQPEKVAINIHKYVSYFWHPLFPHPLPVNSPAAILPSVITTDNVSHYYKNFNTVFMWCVCDAESNKWCAQSQRKVQGANPSECTV